MSKRIIIAMLIVTCMAIIVFNSIHLSRDELAKPSECCVFFMEYDFTGTIIDYTYNPGASGYSELKLKIDQLNRGDNNYQCGLIQLSNDTLVVHVDFNDRDLGFNPGYKVEKSMGSKKLVLNSENERHLFRIYESAYCQ